MPLSIHDNTSNIRKGVRYTMDSLKLPILFPEFNKEEPSRIVA